MDTAAFETSLKSAGYQVGTSKGPAKNEGAPSIKSCAPCTRLS